MKELIMGTTIFFLFLIVLTGIQGFYISEIQKQNLLLLKQCCNVLEQSSQLLECLKGYVAKRKVPDSVSSPSIGISVYVSDHILNYGSSFLLFNLYSLELFQPDLYMNLLPLQQESDYSPNDRRWNKFFSLYHGFNSWARLYDYIILLDADILILPPLLQSIKAGTTKTYSSFITEEIAKNPAIKVIMSEDLLDFANSGVVIAKNDPWSHDFLRMWLSRKDSKNTNCDQHVLNQLSLDLLNNQSLSNNVKIIPFPVINTKFPSVESFASDNMELDRLLIHFLGEYNEIRAAIGRNFSSKACRASERWVSMLSEPSVSISQEGLAAPSQMYEGFYLPAPTPTVLINIKTQTLQQLLTSLLEKYESAFDVKDPNYVATEIFDRLQHFCNFQKGINQSLLMRSSPTIISDGNPQRRSPIVFSPKITCQDYLSSFQGILGNSLHYQYMLLEKLSTIHPDTTPFETYFNQIQTFFSFYSIKISIISYNMSLIRQDHVQLEVSRQPLSEELALLNDFSQQLTYLSHRFLSRISTSAATSSTIGFSRAQIEFSLSIFVLQQRIKLMEPLVESFEERLSRQQLPKKVLKEIIQQEELLMSDVHALINLGEGKNLTASIAQNRISPESVSQLIEMIPNRDFFLQDLTMKYINSCIRFMQYLQAYGIYSEAKEWCQIAVHNIELFASRYEGEDRILVNLQRKVYFSCANSYDMQLESSDVTGRSKVHQYNSLARSYRYHASEERGHYFPPNYSKSEL